MRISDWSSDVCSSDLAIPYTQYTDAMEPPAAGRRHDAWILGRLLQTIGLPSPLDAQSDAYDGRDMIQSLLAARALTIDTVQAAPHSTVVFPAQRSEEHTSELQSLMRISNAVFCL